MLDFHQFLLIFVVVANHCSANVFAARRRHGAVFGTWAGRLVRCNKSREKAARCLHYLEPRAGFAACI
jgi:hypothetical protein